MPVLVADAHPLARDALRALLEARGFPVCAEAGDGSAALELAGATRPELAVVDAALPPLPALELVRRLRALDPSCRSVMTSLAHTASAVREALQAGACGVLDRSAGSGALIAALEAARAGRHYVASSLPADVVPEAASGLTERQRQVLALIAAGRSTHEIARCLAISMKTVETHRAKLMARVGVHKASSLVRYAIRQGLIEP